MRDDFIIKMSREGDDVRRTQDLRLLFNSNWPVPKLIKQGIIPAGTVASTEEDVLIFKHNLGYQPMYLLWEDAALWGEESGDFLSGANRPISFPVNNGLGLASSLYMDKSRFYIEKQPFLENSADYNYYYAILDVDLSEEFDAGSINPGKQGDINPVTRDSLTLKIFNNTIYPKSDARGRSLDSAFQPILLHKISHHNKTSNDPDTIPVKHNLGYPPAFFAYGKFGTNVDAYRMVYFAPSGGLGSAGASVDNDSFYMTITTPFNGSIVLLKDPII